MKEKRQILGKQYFRAQFDKASIDVDKRTIDVVFATERQVCMYNWDMGLFFEVLPCNDQNGDISRLNGGAPLCDTHDTSSVRLGLGVVSKAWFDNAVGRATVRFSKRADVESVWQDVQDEIITGVSVGYNVYEYEQIGQKENLPLVRANKWEATEISLALVQADPDSAVGRSQNEDPHEIIFISNNQNSNKMTQAEKDALKAERQRSAQIVKLCRAANLSADFEQEMIESDFSLDECRAKITAEAAKPAPQSAPEIAKQERARISEIRKAVKVACLPEAFGEPLIENGTILDTARAMIIDEAHKKNPVEPVPQSGVRVGTDEKDKKANGMSSAIMQRSGVLAAATVGEPGEFRGMSLLDVARECLAGVGIETRGMNHMQIASRALQMMTRDGGGGLSSGDFSYILQNVLNKTLRAMYDLQPRTFLPWSRKTTSNDFKNILRTQLSDIKLTKVNEGGEYQFATVSDTGETYKVAKYGKIVNIDWEAIVNDDLSAFSRIPTLLAAAVAQMQGDLMYQILTGAETMGDTIALFDAATHKNYTSAGTDITVASLGIGRKQFRQQVSPGGSPLNLAPKFLVCGPNKEQVALQFLSTNYTATQGSNINVWAGTMQPIVEARITDNSWYLIADPNQIDTAEYATLEGQEIFTESRYGFDVDALQYKVRSVFGKKAIEWRSFYKNAGA